MKQIKLPILFLSILSLTACLEPDLPKCNDKESKQLLSQVVNQNLKKMGEREVLVSLKDIEEVAFNKHSGIRVCKSNAVFSDADEAWFTYKIYWGNSKKGRMEKEFFVEITDGGDLE